MLVSCSPLAKAPRDVVRSGGGRTRYARRIFYADRARTFVHGRFESLAVQVNKRNELAAMLTAVDELAARMKAKLRQKAREGYSGGLNHASAANVGKSLMEHAERLTGYCLHCEVQDGEHGIEENAHQAVDVANLAMMRWVIGGKP